METNIKTKIDPYDNEGKYFRWKEKVNERVPELSKTNSDLLLSYLKDMELGCNVGIESKKGSRSFNRLNTLRYKIISLMNKLNELYNLEDVSKASEEQLHNLFTDMRQGTIKRLDGRTYRAVGDYVKDFKSFWHWFQKKSKKEGLTIPDITSDLDTKKDKPDWVYLNTEQVKQLAESSKYEYRVLIWFLYDTGIRAPTELINVKVSDLTEDCTKLNIREETSKTFGRKINLLLCPKLLREYIKNKGLSADNRLFDMKYYTANKYLKRQAKIIFGDGVSQSGQKYSELSLYDFRHNSACYWISKYNKPQDMMYRFGWKDFDKIHYYTELMGMKDTISEEDLTIKANPEELDKYRQDVAILKDRVILLEAELKKIHTINNLIIEELKGGRICKIQN